MNDFSSKATSIAGMRRFLESQARGYSRVMVQTMPTEEVRLRYAAANPEIRLDELDSHAYGYEVAARAIKNGDLLV